MILILTPNIEPESDTYKQLMGHLSRLQNIQLRIHREQGVERSLTEIYLIGNTSAIAVEDMKTLPGVGRVVRVSEEYRVLGRHKGDNRSAHFDYQGLRFGQDTLHVFAGLCGGYYGARRDDDAQLARQRPGLHAHGRLQAAHESVFIPGSW